MGLKYGLHIFKASSKRIWWYGSGYYDNDGQLYLIVLISCILSHHRSIAQCEKLLLPQKVLLLLLSQVKLQHLRSGKILNFPANEWLSRSRGNGDTFCELPVVERGRSLYSSTNI